MNKGFFKLIILILIAIILLSLFKIRLSDLLLKNEFIRDNFMFVFNGIDYIWNGYLEKPVMFVRNLVYDNLWTPVWEKLQNYNTKYSQ